MSHAQGHEQVSTSPISCTAGTRTVVKNTSAPRSFIFCPVKRPRGADERGGRALSLKLEPDDRKSVGDHEQHRGRKREGERPVEVVVVWAIEHRLAARATCHRAGRAALRAAEGRIQGRRLMLIACRFRAPLRIRCYSKSQARHFPRVQYRHARSPRQRTTRSRSGVRNADSGGRTMRACARAVVINCRSIRSVGHVQEDRQESLPQQAPQNMEHFAQSNQNRGM